MSETVSAPAGMPDDIAALMAVAMAAQKAREEARQKAEADALAASLAAMQAANADAKPTLFPVDEVPAPRNRAGVIGFGPTFAAELAAAGTAGMLFASALDHVTFDPAIPAADRAKVMAVIAAHDPDVPLPFDLAGHVSAAHAALRDGGVTIGGMRIKTDAESRGLIDGAYALSQAQPDATTDFKAASGWVTINAATMQTVAVAVGKWVQACYSAYRQIDGKVADGTFTTTAQVDAAFAAVTLPA